MHPHFPAVAICALVFTLVSILWRTGVFQFFELELYDRQLRTRPRSAAEASRVIVIGITEGDIQRAATYPSPDDVLCGVLEKLTQAEPAAIVVDLYRDLPVPGKDPEGTKKLAEFWRSHPNILAIQRLGLGNEPAVRPPSFLTNDAHQVGFNDFSVDYKVDDTARRALLIMDDGDEQYYGVGFLAAQLYLQQFNIELEQDENHTEQFQLGKAKLRPFEPDDGAYVNADARGLQILLDFRGPATFPTYSITDVLTGKIPAEVLHGNVVIIGPLASSLKDHLITPLAKRFPGLLMHAHVVNQLLRQAIEGQQPLHFWNEWQEALWLFAWCAAGTAIGLWVKSPLTFVAAIAIGVGVLFGAYQLFFAADIWLPVVAPAFALAGAAVLGTSHQAYLEKKQRDMLMQLFSQHVSTEIAADIWRQREQFMDGHSPKAQVITATVLFTDLQGFSAKAESLPPDALLAWLNEYMEVMAALVEQHGGMVLKYMGDAIMAVFGAPIPCVKESEICGDAANAVRCALAMGEQLDLLNSSWTERGLPTTEMRVGIATGSLVSGSIGGAKRLEYTVTGDTVVIAKRLESAEKGSTDLEKVSESCRVLIAESTNTMLGPSFHVREVGPMLLEGKHRSVGAYVVLRTSGDQK